MRLVLALALVSFAACAASPVAPSRIDWAAVDAAFREARWRVDHCADPNHPKCDALWLIREELDEILRANREAFEREHRAEIERLRQP